MMLIGKICFNMYADQRSDSREDYLEIYSREITPSSCSHKEDYAEADISLPEQMIEVLWLLKVWPAGIDPGPWPSRLRAPSV